MVIFRFISVKRLSRRRWGFAALATIAIACLVAFLIFGQIKKRAGIPREIIAQLRDCDTSFGYLTGAETVIVFRKPFVRMEDLMRLGFSPSSGENKNGEIAWTIGFNPAKNSSRQEAIEVRTIFKEERLSRIILPAEVGRFLPANSFYEYLRILGHSSIDLEQLRTVREPDYSPNLNNLQLPNRETMGLLFGAPDREEVSQSSKTVSSYRLTRTRSSARPFEIAFSFRSANDSFAAGAFKVGGFLVIFSDEDIYVRR